MQTDLYRVALYVKVFTFGNHPDPKMFSLKIGNLDVAKAEDASDPRRQG
jgi:hypothetical protein